MTDHTAGPFFAVLLVTFTAGTRLEGRRLAAAFLLGVGARDRLDRRRAARTTAIANLIFSITFAIGAPMLFGQLIVNRSRLNRALGEKARRAETERREQAEAAALEERTRIAGELHDVVAHALSAMTVQASAARRLSERDPGRARDAFATVEHTGREALARAAAPARRAAQGGRGAGAGAAAEPRARRRARAPCARPRGCRWS